MKLKINIKYSITLVCMYILIFQNVLQNFIPIIQYFDEILALSVIPLFIIRTTNKKTKLKFCNRDFIIIFLIITLLFDGFLASSIYKIQPINISLSDALLVAKFFFTYFLAKICLDFEFIEKNKNKFKKHINFLLIIFLFLTIFNYIFKIWPGEYRFGIMSNRLFYSHSTYLAAICIFILSVYILLSDNLKKKRFYTLILMILLLSTMRFKAIGALCAIIGVIFLVNHSNKKISISKFGVLALVALFLVWNQIEYYYIELNDSARSQLTQKSIQIAKDYFPIGAGFGTYGSYMSAVSYSPLYSRYGLNKIYGLQSTNSKFISDTFWPMIIGQFGFIGLICYALIIVCIFKNIQEDFDSNRKQLYLSKICCLLYLLISSTSESSFVHPVAIPLALIIGIFSNKKKGNINE